MSEITNQITTTPVITTINHVTITPAAAAKVQQLITEEGNPKLSLRVYIVGGGCAGFQYGFAFEEKQNPDDHIFNQLDVNVIIDSMSLQYLLGATIDYVENLQGAHFVVINPNANTTCGCGSSFSV